MIIAPEEVTLTVVSTEDLLIDEKALIAYRYLYWACMRGNLWIIRFILMQYGISPFLAENSE